MSYAEAVTGNIVQRKNRRKCKRSNTEKMKLNGTSISKYGDEKRGIVKNNAGNFNSTLNLNFCSIMYNLLEEEQRILIRYPQHLLKGVQIHLYLVTLHSLLVLRLAKTC